MNTIAIVLMVSVQVVVTLATGYFFVRILRTPPRPEPDSFDENDDMPR